MSICDRRGVTALHGHKTTVRIEGMKVTPQCPVTKSIQIMMATKSCGGLSGPVELRVPGSKYSKYARAWDLRKFRVLDWQLSQLSVVLFIQWYFSCLSVDLGDFEHAGSQFRSTATSYGWSKHRPHKHFILKDFPGGPLRGAGQQLILWFHHPLRSQLCFGQANVSLRSLTHWYFSNVVPVWDHVV